MPSNTGIHPNTVAKWKQREAPHDRSHRPHKLQTTLSEIQEAIVVELRKTLLLPLDDLLAVNIAALALLDAVGLPHGLPGSVAAGLLAVSMLAAAIVGRALFYVLVIPTTMPGAFFWRNKSFERHAVETGLADRLRAGILGRGH